MKKLKRHLSQAFRPSYRPEDDPNHLAETLHAVDIRDSRGPYYVNHRNQADGTIAEEDNVPATGPAGIYRRRGSKGHCYPQASYMPDRPTIPARPASFYGHGSTVCEYPNCEPQILIRPKSRRNGDTKTKHKSFTEHLVGSLKKSGKPLFGYRSKASGCMWFPSLFAAAAGRRIVLILHPFLLFSPPSASSFAVERMRVVASDTCLPPTTKPAAFPGLHL
uniref:Protein kinase domain-containing protein n=1 Tax=Panagrellus redivivus TaxID=6233 RepID=A0A7E5A1F0_PANRE